MASRNETGSIAGDPGPRPPAAWNASILSGSSRLRVAKKKESVVFTVVRSTGLVNLTIAPANGETFWLGSLGVPSTSGNGVGENVMKLRGILGITGIVAGIEVLEGIEQLTLVVGCRGHPAHPHPHVLGPR